MKIRDRQNAGRSDMVPYVKNEASADRHARRFAINLNARQEAQQLADKLGLSLAIHNDGHHWQFRKPGFSADWWPSSAKLVINQKWHQGIHCHDYKQALAEIARRLA